MYSVLLTTQGVPKLSDFGVSAKAALGQGLARNASLVGTPYWMAPEVVKGSGALFASDIWSLGCTLVEMSTGKPPFAHLEPLAAIYIIGSRTGPPELPDALLKDADASDFARRCLLPVPGDRPTARALLAHVFLIGPD